MSEIMIDLETLSTKPNALILTIGAIKFNRNDKIKDINKLETFYVRINQDSCKKLDMDIDENTVKWWNQQTNEAKYEVFDNKDRIDIKDALIKFSSFLKSHSYIWANSPSFDCVILENAFNQCNLEIPWKFWNIRDCRTIYDVGNINLKRISKDTISHNALNDCYNQIIGIQKFFTK